MSRAWPLAWVAAGTLAPWLILQGRRVRRTTLELPEPSGARYGQWQLPLAGEPHAASPLSSCSQSDPADPGAFRLRLLLVGDSSMAGVGATHQSEALSGALMRALQRGSAAHERLYDMQHGVRDDRPPGQCSQQRDALRVDWQMAARTGLRTRDMAAALPVLLQDRGPTQVSSLETPARFAPDHFDLALVALGVNDATALQSTRAFRRDVQAFRKRLGEHYGVRRILWSGLPPVHRFPALPQPLRAVLGRKAMELDAVLREFETDYVPMPARLDDAWIATDGFHPGPLAYEAWAAQLAPQLRATVAHLALGDRPR